MVETRDEAAQIADAVRALGAEPVDYRGDVTAQVRALSPGGVDAVFDHVGGPGIVASWRLLARGGTLVSYGAAATKDDPGNSRLPVLLLIARLMLWNALPNGRRAAFFNIWAGSASGHSQVVSALLRYAFAEPPPPTLIVKAK